MAGHTLHRQYVAIVEYACPEAVENSLKKRFVLSNDANQGS
jgi:hypothetical protein